MTLIGSIAKSLNQSFTAKSSEEIKKSEDKKADSVSSDENADKALDKFTRFIALKLFDLSVILNPEKIAIGGGISAQNSM